MSELDINSLEFFNDIEDIDPDAMSTDVQPPPPAKGADGKYIGYTARLKNARGGSGKKAAFTDNFPMGNVSVFTLNNKGHMNLMVEVTVITGMGRQYTTRCPVSTAKFGEDTTTWVDTLLRGTTGYSGAGLSNLAKTQALYAALLTEPEIYGAEFEWVAEYLTRDDAGKTKRKTGIWEGKKLTRMQNFPFVEIDGVKHYKAVENDSDGNEVRTGLKFHKVLPRQM